jgi:predicted secreted protein
MNADNRSKKIILVSHCLLNMNSKYEGTARYPDIAPQLMELFHKYELGIEQMPCPELGTFDLTRKPATKDVYDTPEYRNLCKTYASFMTKLVDKYKKSGCKIMAVIGVSGSTSCGSMITHVGKSDVEARRVPGIGIYMEELQKTLHDIPFVDFDFRNTSLSMQNIEKVLKMSEMMV